MEMLACVKLANGTNRGGTRGRHPPGAAPSRSDTVSRVIPDVTAENPKMA
jgi:hypothetical protein